MTGTCSLGTAVKAAIILRRFIALAPLAGSSKFNSPTKSVGVYVNDPSGLSTYWYFNLTRGGPHQVVG